MVLRFHLLPHQIIHFTFHKRASSINPNHSPKLFSCQNGLKSQQAAAATTSDSGRKFREKILYLQDLNVNLTKALEKNPNIRATLLSSIQSVEHCVSSMGLERAALGRILDMYPQLLTADPHAEIYPVFEFLLNDVEIPFPDIRKSVVRCPRLLISSVEDQLKPAFKFLQGLGFIGPNKITCQTTVLLVSNVEHTLIPKVEFLMGLGFDHEEVANMVLRSPGLLTFSIENNYRPKLEYFLKEMNGDVAELKRFPQYFSFNLEGKIKRRHRILVEHGLSLPLHKMLRVSDGEFTARLIEMQLHRVEEMQL